MGISISLKFYGEPGAGWCRAVIEIYNPHSDNYVINLKYDDGPADFIRFGCRRGQATIYRRRWRDIGSVPPGRTVWDPVYFYFPEKGTYTITFYARPWQGGEEDLEPITTYKIRVGAETPKQAEPVEVTEVAIPYHRPADSMYELEVYVSFNRKAPKETPVYLKYYVNNTLYGTETVYLKTDSYFLKRVLRIPRPEAEEAWFKACANTDAGEWKCSGEVNIGYQFVEACPDPFSIDWKQADASLVLRVCKDDDEYRVVVAVPRDEWTWYKCTYSASELVRPVGNGLVELSPIAWKVVSEAKNLLHEKYVTALLKLELVFDAYSLGIEAFKSLTFSPEEVVKRKVEKAINDSLKKAGIKGQARVTSVKLKYDAWGILLGYNRNVNAEIQVELTLDIPPAVIAAIAIAVIVAAVATVIVVIEWRKIKMLESEDKYYEAYEKWVEFCKMHPEHDKCRDVSPPKPPKEVLDEMNKVLDKAKISGLEEVRDIAKWIAVILGIYFGGKLLTGFMEKKQS